MLFSSRWFKNVRRKFSFTLESCLRSCRGRCACREEKEWAAAAAAVWIEGLWSMRIEGCLFVL